MYSSSKKIFEHHFQTKGTVFIKVYRLWLQTNFILTAFILCTYLGAMRKLLKLLEDYKQSISSKNYEKNVYFLHYLIQCFQSDVPKLHFRKQFLTNILKPLQSNFKHCSQINFQTVAFKQFSKWNFPIPTFN